VSDQPGTAGALGGPLALGCAGFVTFYAIAAVFALAIGALEWGALALAVLLALAVALFVSSARRAAPGGRVRYARFAVGFGVAAVVFGGCLALVINGLQNMH
jgi:hypothetical protein